MTLLVIGGRLKTSLWVRNVFSKCLYCRGVPSRPVKTRSRSSAAQGTVKTHCCCWNSSYSSSQNRYDDGSRCYTLIIPLTYYICNTDVNKSFFSVFNSIVWPFDLHFIYPTPSWNHRSIFKILQKVSDHFLKR